MSFMIAGSDRRWSHSPLLTPAEIARGRRQGRGGRRAKARERLRGALRAEAESRSRLDRFWRREQAARGAAGRIGQMGQKPGMLRRLFNALGFGRNR